MPEEISKKEPKHNFREKLWFKALTECFGTLMLVFLGVLIGQQMSNTDMAAQILVVSLVWGLAVTFLAYTLGPISGCHLNPSVSIALAIQKKITWKEFFAYVGSQIVGAFLGALLAWILIHPAVVTEGNTVCSTMVSSSLVSFHDSYGGRLFMGGILELIGTFVLVFFILYITSDPKYSAISGVAIGLVLFIAIAVLYNFTGGSLNGARSLGTALVALFNGETEPIKEIWVYLIFPTAGGALAAVLDNVFHKEVDA